LGTSSLSTAQAPKLDWVQCDTCARWEIFDNTGTPGKYNEERMANTKFVCRACGTDRMIKELTSENASLKTRISVLEEAKKTGALK